MRTNSFASKLIYVFRINNDTHRGCLKIGEATTEQEGQAPNSTALNRAARRRIDQYTQTAGITYELLYTEAAVYTTAQGTIRSFSDAAVHQVLLRSGIRKKVFDTERKANEWFVTDLETVKQAIRAVKEERNALHSTEISEEQSPVVFRPEQREAIQKTLKQFRHNPEMLWFAKMRFGKTLSALQVIKESGFKQTIILTHRPVVDGGWFEDFRKIFYDSHYYRYGSRTKGDSFETLERLRITTPDSRYIYFASIQDLRGSTLVGGQHDKNEEILRADWDCMIVDEAHEGTQTTLGEAVIQELRKSHTKILHLSGTPYNLLDKYKEDEIYTWDYVMEQRAKAQWDTHHYGDPNPYASLPKLHIYTYQLGKELRRYADEEMAFNFREFFRVDSTGGFRHEADVRSFLHLLCKEDQESRYPYATRERRDHLRHTLWMVPGVKEAKALSKLLREHPVFGQFEIVNVAGEGDEEEAKEEALQKVNRAIGNRPHETYTITLSCGRLTTGVSVGAWTGVLMLSGSHSSSASAYMQTIFRVQTPAESNGKVKEACFVFDFAPDRTLKVIAEAAKISAKAGKTTDGDRATMGEFLNFCPIIAIDGSTMQTYDENRMLEQLKRVYVERVIRNGFEDGYLYNNDELMKLGDIELAEFEQLKKIIGSTRAMPKSGDVDVNNQGFTNEEYEKLEAAQRKPPAQRTEEEQRLVDEKKEKRKNRDVAVSILRGISIRMPLLLYGAPVKDEETEISIDNFTQLIDDQSWGEFMPKGVSKADFRKFKKYYEPDVFRAAGKRIRALARAADSLPIEDRIARITGILAPLRNPDKETVLTPWRVVNKHLGDCLGGYVFLDPTGEQPIELPRQVIHGSVSHSVFAPEARILEINSKSGLYPLYVAYSVYRSRLKRAYPTLDDHTQLSVAEQQAHWDRTLAENIFVICNTPMAKSITQRTLAGFREVKVNSHYFENLLNQITQKPDAFIAKVKKGKSYWNANQDNTMKFDAIVGNPPYQLTTEGTSDKPIYHLYMDIAFKISDKVTFITPARFLFNAGKTPREWNAKILADKHFKVVWYESNSSKIFPNVDIKGGVTVTFRDKSQNFGGLGIYTIHEELNSILSKVTSAINYQALDDLIYTQNKFNLDTLFTDFPHLRDVIGSNGREKRLTSSIFDQIDLFSEGAINDDDIRILGLVKNTRYFRYIPVQYIESHENLNKYKVLIPKSNGTGQLGESLSSPLIGRPYTGYTQSFIGIGAYQTLYEAESCLKYVKTKFLRAMLGILKVTQDNSKEVWQFVPLQDFGPSSDIDWSGTIGEIDRQLYAKYGLSDDEVAFVERMIKPMAE